jgi:hypothetical protein
MELGQALKWTANPAYIEVELGQAQNSWTANL